MKPEYVLDEEGISQRFKYAKTRLARDATESALSSAEPPASPIMEPGPLSPGAPEDATTLSQEPGPSTSCSCVQASPSPGGGVCPVPGPSTAMEACTDRIWHPTQSPTSLLNTSVNSAKDWFSTQNESRPNISPGRDWFSPPETIIKEEVEPVQPIRVSVIRSNPNTPIKREEHALGSQRIPHLISHGRKPENFILTAPPPMPQNPFWDHHNSTNQEPRHDTFSHGLENPNSDEFSHRICNTQRTIINLMTEFTPMQRTYQEDLIECAPEEKHQQEPRFEDLSEKGTNIDNSYSDNMIKHYLHKKFRKLVTSNCEDMEENREKEITTIITRDPFENQGDMESDSLTSISSLLYQPCVIDTQEMDLFFVADMEKVFLKAWRQVNCGEFVMQAYMDFCVKKGDLDPMFYTAANMQFRCEAKFIILEIHFFISREKFLNFIVNYDVIDLPMKTLYNVIKRNLGIAQSLIYVFQFNQTNAEQELRYGSGDIDWEQWQVTQSHFTWTRLCSNPSFSPQNREDKSIKAVQFSEMMHHILLPDSSKMELLSCLLQMCLPIMQDSKIFILTFLLGRQYCNQ